jgi:peptidoglycan/xylan/chitin deacetylase (PgdA/CDA1 family)
MAIGSHTHSHEILSRLSASDQFQELAESRRILQEKLNIPADTLAFPVGGRTAFTADTLGALKRAGYKAGFSFYGGVNLAGQTNRFNMLRMPADRDPGQGNAVFRLRARLAAASGRQII